MLGFLVISLLAAEPQVATTTESPAPPRYSVGVDLLHVYNSALGGDVVLPLEFDAPLYKRLRFLGRFHAGMATGPGLGLFALGGQVGFRVYPFSPVALKGFHIGLAAGGDLPFTTSPGVFGWPRPSATLSFGYGVLIKDKVQLTPGLDITPIGLGFPMVAPLTLHLGVAYAY